MRPPPAVPARAPARRAATLALCAPVYWVGLLAILLFGNGIGRVVELGFVDSGLYEPLTRDPLEWLRALIVPWIVAGAPLAAISLRLTAATMLDAADAEFVRTALGKGLSPRAVAYRHTLPTALAPTVSFAGAYTPLLVGNVLLVEQVFNIPGVFRYTTGAVSKRRLPAPPGDGARRCRAGGRWEPARGPHAGVCSIRAYARSSRGGSPPVEGVGGPVFRPEGGGDRPLDFGHPPGLERPACRRWSSTA
jgi:hypothetical protein